MSSEIKGSFNQEALVKRLWESYVKENDKNAFGKLYSIYHNRLTLYCLGKLRNRELAENASSETLIKLLQVAKPEEISDFESWLFKVAKNTCLTLLSTANRRQEILQTRHKSISDSGKPEIEKKMDADDLRELIHKTLDETNYEIWELHQMGYDNEEIGEKLNMNIKTVANRKAEARRQLREKIKNTQNL
jgi:RNA polymerase sigma factor (sigma-70 family)